MHEAINLLTTLGNTDLDEGIWDLIVLYIHHFPDQRIAWYIEGSYADGTGITTSDLDLDIIFSMPLTPAQRTHAQTLWQGSALSHTHELDIDVLDTTDLAAGVNPNLKLGGKLLYGEDICQHYPLVPLEVWTRERMHAAYYLTITVYQRPQPVDLPLTFPASQDEFLGYTRRTLQLPDGTTLPCTRDIIRTTGWAATALLAWRAGVYVSGKKACHQLYQKHIAGPHSNLLADIYEYCRGTWNYLLPSEAQARAQLRSICTHTLEFEHHFIAEYRTFLLAELSSSLPEARHKALWVQERVPFHDEEVLYAIQQARLHTL